MPALSIILPVYNVEKYLPLCLESVRAQTLHDIEIICVNDGSTDRSAVLLGMAADVDERVRVVTKANGGLSSARNAGLDVATGDYVWFVDSDDFVHPRAAATIVDRMATSQADILTFGAYVHPIAHTSPWLERTLKPREVTFDGYSPELLFVEASRPFVWRSACSRDFLEREGLRFNEDVPFGEDQVFYFAAYPLARRTALISDQLYYYRASRPDSLMASRFEQRALMLREHHHIARVILDDWARRGWIHGREADLLGWLMEFLGEDAAAAPDPLGADLRASLAQILRDYIPQGAGLNGLSPGVSRWYGAASGEVGGASQRRAVLSWKAQRHPRAAVQALIGKVGQTWPVRRARGIAWRLLPPSERTQWEWFRDMGDARADDARRDEALRLLYVEWSASRG